MENSQSKEVIPMETRCVYDHLITCFEKNDEDFIKGQPTKFENEEIRQTGIKKRNWGEG